MAEQQMEWRDEEHKGAVKGQQRQHITGARTEARQPSRLGINCRIRSLFVKWPRIQSSFYSTPSRSSRFGKLRGLYFRFGLNLI